jgi:hypothetical protein
MPFPNFRLSCLYRDRKRYPYKERSFGLMASGTGLCASVGVISA